MLISLSSSHVQHTVGYWLTSRTCPLSFHHPMITASGPKTTQYSNQAGPLRRFVASVEKQRDSSRAIANIAPDKSRVRHAARQQDLLLAALNQHMHRRNYRGFPSRSYLQEFTQKLTTLSPKQPLVNSTQRDETFFTTRRAVANFRHLRLLTLLMSACGSSKVRQDLKSASFVPIYFNAGKHSLSFWRHVGTSCDILSAPCW